MRAKEILFESPDHVRYQGRYLDYDIKTQRSIIIFDNKEVWVSNLGDTHMSVYRYPVKSLTKQNCLYARVWVDVKIISFWNSLVQKFGHKWTEYLEALTLELKNFNIDIKELQFDIYAVWNGMDKKVAIPELMVTYYDDNEDSPLVSYDEFVEYLKYSYKKTATSPSNTHTSSELYGSKKTGWDSKDNIAVRQAKSTSESFYPIIFK